MKRYLEKRNNEVKELYEKMKELRDTEIDCDGDNAGLFTLVVAELSYRVAEKPDFGAKRLCPKCETPVPTASYDHYCGFCGQFIDKEGE